MNIRIACSLILSLGFYAGTTFGMLSRTSQRLGGAASRGATALGTTARRIPSSTLRLGSTPTSRALMTTPPGSIGSRQAPLGNRSMSTSSPDADSLAMKQLFEQAETRFPSDEQEQSNKGQRLTLRGLVSDLMLWVSTALAVWAAKEFVDAKKEAAFQEQMKALSKKRREIEVLLDRLDRIENDFNNQSASSDDKKTFVASLEAAQKVLLNEYSYARRVNPHYNIEDLTQLTDKVIVQLEEIVNKYKAPQSYSDWAYEKVSNVGSRVRTGISGLARSLAESRQARAQQRAAIAGQPVPELPTHTSRGALTPEGQQQKLLERLKREGHVVEDVD